MKFLLSVVAFLLFPIVGVNAQRNIVESLQANRAGEGTVTVHQDAQITKMIGERYVHSGTGQEKIRRKQFAPGTFRGAQCTAEGAGKIS